VTNSPGELPPDPAAGHVAPAPPRWGFWATCAWGLAALAALYLAQMAALLGLLAWWKLNPEISPTAIIVLTSNAMVVSAATLAGLPATLLVLALAARLAGARIVDYLALEPIDARTIGFALACTLGYGVAITVLGTVIHRPASEAFAVELYRTAHGGGLMALMLVAVVIAAPLTEEAAVPRIPAARMGGLAHWRGRCDGADIRDMGRHPRAI
jgi:hypothetical protein